MPLKLVPPRKGKTPYWAVRGNYLRKHVDRSTKTGKRAIAKKILRKWEIEIERGEFAGKGELTFASAALAYMKAGGDRVRLKAILGHFGDMPLTQIDQAKIDGAADKLFPKGTAPTRNREVYTPISAVLKHVGIDFKINRPKGWRGNERTDWLEPEQAFAVFLAADGIDEEFGCFLRVLCYTGLRLGEAVALRIDKLSLQESHAQVLNSKIGAWMGVYLPPVLVIALANHPRGLERAGEKVFRFVKCGRLYTLLRAVEKTSGVKHLTFHLFRHTWATWMRRYANMDVAGLLATERWKDAASARRYQHVVVSEESRKAELLPTENVRKTGSGNAK